MPRLKQENQNIVGFAALLTHGLLDSTDPLMEPYPHQFATALFSFLYHLASYDAGGEALVSCGMMEALLKVQSLPEATL